MTIPAQKHLVIEICAAPAALLDDLAFWQELLPQMAQKAGSAIVGRLFHRFTPQGLSGVLLLAESHLTVHTWPECGQAALDFFTCGSGTDPEKSLSLLKEALPTAIIKWRLLPADYLV